MGLKNLGAAALLFGNFFFLVTLGAVVKRFGERAVIILIGHDAPHFLDLFSAGIASHTRRLSKLFFEVNEA